MGVTNLSTLFLREFFRNLKVLYAPGFEDESFDEDLNINNLVKNLKSFYQSKGTGESINTLISILFGQQSSVRKQSEFLFEPSQASFRRRLVLVAEKVGGGNPLNLSGQTLFQDDNENSTEINGASNFQFLKWRTLLEVEDHIIQSISIKDIKILPLDLKEHFQ